MEYGLIGARLGHSYSCELHRKIGAYPYELCELPPEELARFFERRAFKAINVTIPYKKAVIPYLDWCSDMAGQIGAVNTVVNRGGKLYGYNTDYAGLCAALSHMRLQPQGKNVLILGTGGTAATARAAAAALGAANVTLVSRSEKPGAIPYQDAMRRSDTQIIINATPVGMFPEVRQSPLPLSGFPQLVGVLDAIYHPLRTELVLEGQARGIPATGGLYMLTAQAVHAAALFFGTGAGQERIDDIYRTVLSEKQNIVLIGMPGAGKTVIGQEIAALTGKRFIDTDTAIVERAGMPIAALFRRFGEAAFRKLEHEIIRELSVNTGCVIATGGGAAMDGGNLRELRRGGVVCLLDRAPEALAHTADRPLAASKEQTLALYARRYSKYKAAADIAVYNNRSIQETAKAVLEEISHEAANS